MGHCLTLSLIYKKPVLLLDSNWRYGFGCVGRKKAQVGMMHNCFFEPFGSLSCKTLSTDESNFFFRTADGKKPHKFTSYEPSELSSSWVGDRFRELCSHHPNPALALKAAVLRYSFRLNGMFSKLLQTESKRMGLRRPYAALHVRRGVSKEKKRGVFYLFL
jgi:hypothetical protein